MQTRIRDLAAARVRYGYRRLHVLLRREGWCVDHKRICRLYRQAGPSLRLKTRKKRISAARVQQPAPTAPNQCWSMDFMSDSLYDGRRFRVLTLVDNNVTLAFIIAAWRKDYNTVRPHTALANLTPAAYKAKTLEKLRLAQIG